MTFSKLIKKFIQLLSKTKWQILLLLLITFIAYNGTLKSSFVWDDRHFVINWQETKNLTKFFWDLMKGNVPIGYGSVYRPIRSLFYVFSYIFFKINPFYYHLQAIIIHLLAVYFSYNIALKICKQKFIAFITALFFALHPIHTEAVAWITASFDTLGNLFFLIAYYYFLKFRETKIDKSIYLSYLFSFLSFFSNEITLILPFIIVLHDLIINRYKFKQFISNLNIYIPYFLINFSYWFIRFKILNLNNKTEYIFGNVINSIFFAPKLLIQYWQYLILPINLNINHIVYRNIDSYYYHFQNQTNKIFLNIFDLDVILPLILVTVLIFFLFKIYSSKPLYSFCVVWMLVCLIPVLQIFPTRSLIFSERYSYLASFGFCFLFALITKQLTNITNNKVNKIVYFFLFLISLSYLVITYSRNKDWYDELSLWQSSLKIIPNDSLALNNLGLAYYRHGNFDLALKYLKESIEYAPENLVFRSKLAFAYMENNYFNEALTEFKILAEKDASNFAVYNYLGDLYLRKKDIDKAILNYQKAASLNKSNNYAKYQLEKLKKSPN